MQGVAPLVVSPLRSNESHINEQEVV